MQKNVGVSPSVFIVFGVLSYVILLIQKVLFEHKLNEETELVIRANFIIFPFGLLLYLLLSQLERNNYDNYVFSTFHIHLASFEQLVFFSFLLTLFYPVSFLSKLKLPQLLLIKTPHKNQVTFQKSKVVALAFYATVLFLSAIQLVSISAFVLNDAVDILRHPFASFHERQIEKFGGPYKTYDFIKRHTEADSIIAVPPQFIWGIVGNIGFSRYFLYPRFLIHPEDFTPENMPDIDYYIIGEPIPEFGQDTYKHWPTKAMEAEQIWLFNERLDQEIMTTTTLYDPADPQFMGRWGIIKPKK